jgi:Fe-S-cluster containining protein
MEHTRSTAPAYCLRLHAAYRCQHAGACCTAGWAIPIEEPATTRVQRQFAGRASPLFLSGDAGQAVGPSAILARTPGGDCVFFERDGNLCVIHRDMGPDSLPVACQHFPRVVLQRPRATRISLSHFCPTAAMVLRSPAADAFDIVTAPASLSLDGRAEGLDARDTLPPLLRPGMLMDEDGYDAWERRCLEILGRGDRTADQAVAVIAAATGAVQSWRPGGVTLSATVDHEFDVAYDVKPDEDLVGLVTRARLAVRSVPRGLSFPPPLEDAGEAWRDLRAWWGDFDGTVRAYLAARLFGNWVAYYGQGLHAVVDYLRVTLAVVKMEAVRHHARGTSTSPWQTVNEAVRNADLLLVHLADARTLALSLR